MSRRSKNFNSPIAPLPKEEVIDISELRGRLQSGEVDIVCVVGPTASGKTHYAVQLARALGNAEILSADSRQVYRGMDIGTGKDLSEYEEVPYHLIDIVPAGEKYNAYRYKADFDRVYADVRSRGKVPILCGGSGLYVQAAVEGFSFDEDGASSSLHPYYIGTLVSRAERIERIDSRLKERLAGGMIEEVQRLLGSGVPAETLIYYGLEYKYVTLYLQGELSYSEMQTQLADAIHRFAKRQMTWWRRLERSGVTIHWVKV